MFEDCREPLTDDDYWAFETIDLETLPEFRRRLGYWFNT